MRKFSRVVAAAAAGALLWAGAGEAWADSCRSRRGGTRIHFSYGSPHHGGWGWGRSWGSHYGYRPVRYVQVVTPVQTVVTAPTYAETVVVNVRNSNGSYTPVTLRRVGNVYVGPRGEQYFAVPTEDQLKAVYGLE